MEYAMDAGAGGTLFETEQLTQRVGRLAGEHHEADADEVVYVLEGTGQLAIGTETHELRAGVAIFVSRGLPWSAEGDARGVSVLVHEPVPSTGHAVLDLNAGERGTATAGRKTPRSRSSESPVFARQCTSLAGRWTHDPAWSGACSPPISSTPSPSRT